MGSPFAYAPQRKDDSREAACVPFAVSLYKKGIAENFRKYEKTSGATYSRELV